MINNDDQLNCDEECTGCTAVAGYIFSTIATHEQAEFLYEIATQLFIF